MNLYMIQYDGQEDYVEAGNMGAAVEIWERAGKADRDFDGTEQPESVALVHDAAVLRAPASLARQTIEGLSDGDFMQLNATIIDLRPHNAALLTKLRALIHSQAATITELKGAVNA